MDRTAIRKALDHFENDEYVDAKEIISKEIAGKRDVFLQNKIELSNPINPKPNDDSDGVDEAINWEEFYNMSKDKTGNTFKEYEKKYGGVKFQMPHIRDALKKSKDFTGFMKMIKKFEG